MAEEKTTAKRTPTGVGNRGKGFERRRIFDAATGKEIKHSDIPAIEPPRSAPVVHLVSGLTEAKIASPS